MLTIQVQSNINAHNSYTEAIEIRYAKNSFYFEDGTILSRWIEIVPPACQSLIRHNTLESPTGCGGHDSPSFEDWSDMIKAPKG
jgi:hypothetical protein